MRDMSIIEMAFVFGVAFYVAMWGNPIDHIKDLFKQK